MKSKKILVFHIGSLGDTLVSVPSLWVIRENFPDAHITMLTDNHVGRHLVQPKEILDGSGLIDDYITYPVNLSSKVRRLSPFKIANLFLSIFIKNFDTLVYLVRAENQPFRVSRDLLFFKFAGINNFIGTEEFYMFPPKQPDCPLPTVPHVADSLLERLQASGLQVPKAGKGRVDVNISELERDGVNKWLARLPSDGGRKWVGICHGSKMPCKIWPFEKYLRVGQFLIEEYDLWPIVFGGPGDRDMGAKLVQELGRGYVPAGVLGVRDSMAAMERCLMSLGNDTGTMHMAAASGLRCVVPFSSRDFPGLWYPYGDGHVVLRTQVSCEGCMLEECIVERMKCILSISVQQVIEACRSILCGLNPAGTT